MTVAEPADIQALTMYSNQDIVEAIENKRQSARTGRESWDKLHEVASNLAGAPTSSLTWNAGQTTWQLEKVSIMGFRGVVNDTPLEIIFDPTPGITVLHGLNGAGKSSISDAVDIALSGRIAQNAKGKAGSARLWDPIHLARGASRAQVILTLVGDDKRLTLQAILDADGAVESHQATLQQSGDEATIELDASWNEALVSHQPVFAYASLERQVQLSKDLASYFEGLLALGGSFSSLQTAVSREGEASAEALRRWRSAKDEAMRRLATVDLERSGSSSVHLEMVPEPTVDQNKEDWVENAQLSAQGSISSSLPTDTKTRLSFSATELQGAIRALDESSMTMNHKLSTALQLMQSEALAHHVSTSTCPVCASEDVNWIEILKQSVISNTQITTLRQQVTQAHAAFKDAVESLLVPAVAACSSGGPSDTSDVSSSTASRLIANFQEAARETLPTQHSALTASAALAQWVLSEEGTSLIEEALSRTDQTRLWRIARSHAVQEFIAVWSLDGDSARETTLWTKTARRVEELRNALRERRSDVLQGKASLQISKLLADADLRLNRINAQSTKANMELVDRNDNAVELGMLSAGQRNAVLLAPLLASVEAGPFGFILLDDPVHAFDELRIDHLAELLSELAETRRVIVLTHDDRLKEHLVARAKDTDTRLVDRSSASGNVEVTDSSQFWVDLLTDAGTIHDLAVAEAGSTLDVSMAVRRLCRLGLDNALRTFTLRNAALSGRNTALDLQAIDAVRTTAERMTVASNFWQDPGTINPVLAALQECSPYAERWNQAIHGNEITDAVTRAEIKKARKACSILAKAS
ncbi:AAA family ATPase [Clavibacter sp. VKM Ac-2872]|uniref:AAA family ATPase n=1 Tax=Clavibacter sp. VKM Ac-2872 TaxID=2783812 RepID=UPI00188A36EB|nr:AAA family ATPase [Clavibacter sp. VKM Ac-2872]MBF4623312.1 AAA family ATPase [Clavibacter sp. VKM Ac-2872]